MIYFSQNILIFFDFIENLQNKTLAMFTESLGPLDLNYTILLLSSNYGIDCKPTNVSTLPAGWIGF